ncbi:MAG TPA: LamG-like jellyroll fold domain-containing protein [Verrucomicrobiae bacterium]|nr:LamG-like jellyroll fold domain-containing protein [Verrucomicrobiae bacterium]
MSNDLLKRSLSSCLHLSLLPAIALVWLLGMPFGLCACAPAPADIVSWWPLEGDASDLLGGNNGVAAGGAVFTTGYVGQGLSLNGNGAAVQLGSAANLQLQDFTVEGWVARADASSVTTFWTGIGFIFAFGPGGYGFAANNSGELVLTAVGVDSVASPAVLLDTAFHHVAVTKSGSSVVFYIDGTAYPAPAYGTTFSFNTPAALGAQGNDLTSSFWGTIDEVSVYSRALSAAEIQSIYAAGSDGKCPLTTSPEIISQPSDFTTFIGGYASFSVRANGAQPLSYQWTHDNVSLPGATSSSLVLTGCQDSDAGQYAVQVSNGYGSTNSAPATLTVLPNTCYTAPTGLVSWWAAEGNVADSGYGGNIGLPVPPISYMPGESGQAFSFDGVTNAVVIPAAPNLAVQSITIEGWILITDTSLPRPIVEYGNTTGPCSMNFWYNFGPGIVGVPGALYGFFRGTNSSDYVDVGSPAGVLSPNQWNHFALTFDDVSGLLTLYANGVGVATNTAPVPIYWNSLENVNLGYRPAGSSDLWGGRRHIGGLDEVSIYNRALSPDEIANLYAAGPSGKCALPPSPPFITAQPSDQHVLAGGTGFFRVGAGGSQPLYYQWYYNAAPVVGATTAWLTLTNVAPSDEGNYSCTVSNSLGSLGSSNAALTVTVLSIYANHTLLTNSPYVSGSNVLIQMQNAYPGGPIFYTLDGSAPTFSSAEYTNSFTLTQSAKIRALGYSPDFYESGDAGPFTISILPNYTLRTLTAGGGTVAVNPLANTYLSNSVVQVTARPGSGWTFLQWLGDANDTNPVISVTLDRSKAVQAVFGTTLHTTAAGGGSVTLSPPGGVYPYGSTVWLTAVPQPGNYFGIWGNAASGSVNPLSFTITTPNPTVSSLFAAVGAGQAGLTLVPLGRGQAAANPRANVYSTGANVTLTATPNPGQTFLGWSGDVTGMQNPLGIILTTNKLIYANFSDKPSVSVQAAYNGLKSDGFQLTVLGDYGAHYRIDGSSDFSTWTPLGTVTNVFGAAVFSDPAAPSIAYRFYRAVQVP